MKKAKAIKTVKGFMGQATLFELKPPLNKNKYVVVSATVAMFDGPEVLIFPASESGKVSDFSELGGYRGGLSMKEAFRRVGYKVIE